MNNSKILGVPVSPGKVFGKALLLNQDKDEAETEELIIPKYISSFDLEQARLGQAIQSSKLELNHLKEKNLKHLNEEAASAFKSYLTILENPEILKQTLIKIRNESVNAEWALKNIAEQFITASTANANILREVTSNLISTLLKKKKDVFDQLTEPVILVARDLTLIQVASMNPKNILGLLIESGESSGPAAIMARSLAIPAIAGLKNINSIIKNGDRIIFDGKVGAVVINPSTETVENF